MKISLSHRDRLIQQEENESGLFYWTPAFPQNSYYVYFIRSYVILSEPVFDAHNYPNVWVVWVLLSHFTDGEIEVNRV